MANRHVDRRASRNRAHRLARRPRHHLRRSSFCWSQGKLAIKRHQVERLLALGLSTFCAPHALPTSPHHGHVGCWQRFDCARSGGDGGDRRCSDYARIRSVARSLKANEDLFFLTISVYGVVPLSLCRNGGCGGGGTTDSAAAAHAAAVAAAADFEDEIAGAGETSTALSPGEETNSGRVRFATARNGGGGGRTFADERLLRHHRLVDASSPSDEMRSFGGGGGAAPSTASGGVEAREHKRDSSGALHPLADVVSATSSTITPTMTRHACGGSHGESQRRRKLSAESCKCFERL